jgi:NADH-ubiquinone oxidoreductase chain 5
MSDSKVQNFLCLYLAFVVSIFWLILRNRFYWIILGWDGLGVVSYLLITYYISAESSSNALFAIFQNRFGDFFFVAFLVGLLSSSITTIIYLKFITIFLILGAIVKRAQFPFNSWLLAAISAPTPISSLVHSSTLVVAGVYILLQFHYCFIEWLVVLKALRFITLVFSSVGLLIERDLKKLIAYSTMRHVRLIIFMYRIQLYKLVYFHLNIHALFKSLIFMCFGIAILSSYHRQDKRLVTLTFLAPTVKILYYYACLCLIGLPYLVAFFSKDFMIEKVWEISESLLDLVFLIVFLGISSYYRFKLLTVASTPFPVSTSYFNSVRVLRLLSIVVLRIRVVNFFIRLIFRVTLEILPTKIFIYIIVLSFFCIRVLSNLNYKSVNFDKFIMLTEIWKYKWGSFDVYVFRTLLHCSNNAYVLGRVKLLLVANWWVILFIIIVF